jgi:SAM-dependent methyltransferase
LSVARRVRQIYEDHPYPTVADAGADPLWVLPPPDWITDLWQPARGLPTRILAAGCGTGNEAFALRQRFPKSEIVGIDFCPNSIATARKIQRARGLRGMRFAVVNLGEKQFHRRIGKFDFICCHGVLSYVPRRQIALQNLRHWLKPGGALYLGVNGSSHFSIRWRRALSEFGFDAVKKMPEDKRLSKVLALLDSLSREEIVPMARREPSFLPTDLFGPFISTSSLREWIEDSARAGLHFLGAHIDHPPFKGTVNNESYTAFMPQSRAAVAQVIDIISPVQFHRLLLSRDVAPSPPWDRPHELARWRPTLATHLRNHRLPKLRGAWKAIRTIKIKSELTNTQLELRTREWIVEVLRQSHGEMSLADILAKSHGSIRSEALRKHLYLLHQLYFLNFATPKRRA